MVSNRPRVSKAFDYEVKYHDGRMKRSGVKHYFGNLLKDVDCVIDNSICCISWNNVCVKEVADDLGIKVVYQRSKGISGVLQAVHDNVAFY